MLELTNLHSYHWHCCNKLDYITFEKWKIAPNNSTALPKIVLVN